jgi:phosphopantetheinyl transferase (holo-ACP synthase)
MTIVGLGVDLLDTARVSRAMDADPDFVTGIGMTDELVPTNGVCVHLDAATLAGLLFSAREAVAKAAALPFQGTSWLRAISLKFDGKGLSVIQSEALAARMPSPCRWHIAFAVRGTCIATLAVAEGIAAEIGFDPRLQSGGE